MSVTIRELKTENDIDTLLSLLPYEDDTKQRIKNDFSKGYFRSLCALENDSWLGFLVFCDSYSTWQHRIFFCSDVYLIPLLETREEKFPILKLLFNRLFQIARDTHANRVNLNLNSELEQEIIDMVCSLGAINLTQTEEWLIFEMGLNQMKDFVSLKTPELNSEYKLVQLDFENFDLYIDQVINLIREIAIFEKMLDQFATSKDDLFRDFQFNGTNPRRQYEMILTVKGDEVVGYSIYHLKYELKKGLGFYLEEIFIKDVYRHQGIGTIIWQKTCEYILANYEEASYLHWTVLEWNKAAIEFYYKFKSINLNEAEKLNHVRFCTPIIYLKQN